MLMKKDPRINRKRLVNTFLDMIRINSPSFREGPVGDYLEARLRPLGFRVTRQKYDRSFNVIASRKGSIGYAQPLILSAHMDTIEPTEGIRYRVTDKMIRSVGDTVLGADDKSAIAQIIEAVTVATEQDIPHGDIEIVITSAEEKGLHGAKNLDYRKIKGRHALVIDSGGRVGRIVIAAPTHVTYEMRVTGRPAHAGIEPEKGINAIRVAAEIIAAAPDGRIDRETTANIGVISGGTATNVVPREVVVRGEVRGHDARVVKRIKDDIFRQARAIAAKRKARVRIAEDQEYRSFKIDAGDPFLGFVKNVFVTCGISPELVITGGGSDANIFNAQGIRAINISNGMQNVHSHEEFIEIEDLEQGCRIALSAIEHFAAGLSGKDEKPEQESG
ncbi:MAG TPA: M20/M25/M40 family metallo-hydrolase [Thermodesulfovibrionales bacterium]|nr:M20/M25/M40 family metallo-hydrolase [Thermodesulfovibrionales bacterium]